MFKNKVGEVGLLICIAVAALVGLTLYPFEYEHSKFSIKPINVFSEVVKKGEVLQVPLTQRILTDSIVSIHKAIAKQRADNPATIIEFGNDSTCGLTYFFRALNDIKTKKKKARIGYFGDSMIEGDLITQDLRKLLQDKFGGDGVGFVPITSIVAGFRQTVIHTFSENWRTYNLLDAPAGQAKLGICGYGFEPLINTVNAADTLADNNWGSWVKYIAVKQPHLNNFKNIQMYYGAGGEGNYMYLNNSPVKLNGQQAVNEAEINSQGITALKASFKTFKSIPIYGFSMESDSGIYIDNFSFRGNSGMPLTKISSNVLSGMDNYLEYDLIVLQYGVNVVDKSVTDYSWYERGMVDVVNHIKGAMPNASILIISTSDRAIRQNGVYTTDPAIPLLVETQKRIAEKTNCAFWNLYQAMGGQNSMINWVQADTALANKDYTHFNFRGAKKVAELLFKYLMEKHDTFNKNNLNKIGVGNSST